MKNDNKLSLDEYFILLAALIDAADFVANIFGTYGAFLKIWRSMALKNIHLEIPQLFNNGLQNLDIAKNSMPFMLYRIWSLMQMLGISS